MANISEDVSFSIGAKDNTGDGVAKAKANLQGLANSSAVFSEKMIAHWEKFKGAYTAVSAAIAAASVTIKKMWDAMEKAAGYLEQMKILDALAAKYDTTAQEIVKNVKEMSNGLIGSSTAAAVALSGIAKGLTPDMIYGLAEASTILSDVMGVTAKEAFERMGNALEMNKQRTLKLVIGTIDLKDKYGEISDTWSEAQKQLAFYNMIMDKAAEITKAMGDEQESLADKMERFETQLAGVARQVGFVLIRAIMLLVSQFQAMNAEILFSIMKWEQLWGNTEKAAMAYQQHAAMAKKAADNLRLATASEEEWTRAKNRSGDIAKQSAKSQGEYEKAIKTTTDAMEKMAAVVAKMGEERLKFASSEFADGLKKEGATIAELRDKMNEYLYTISAVYDARIDGERELAAAAAKIGAKPEDQQKIQIETLKVEQAYLVERQGAWKTYYDGLTGLHSTAVDLMKTKTTELKALEDAIAKQRQDSTKGILDLQTQLSIARGKSASDESIYAANQQALHTQQRAAESLSGQARIDAWEKYKTLATGMTSEVTRQTVAFDWSTGKWGTALDVVKTKEDMIKQAIDNVASAQKQIEIEQNAITAAKEREISVVTVWKDGLVAAMATAKAEMVAYQEKIIALSASISEIERSIVVKISIQDEAIGPLQGIKDVMEELKKGVTIPINMADVGSSGGGGGYAGVGVGYRVQGVSPRAPSMSSPLSNYDKIKMPSEDPSWWNPGLLTDKVFTDTGAGDTYYGSNYQYGSGTDTGYDEGFASGLPYVPRDNFRAKLHEGEAVLTREEAREWRRGKGGQVINFSPNVNIVGANKSPEQLAREIVKPLQLEMRRLSAVN